MTFYEKEGCPSSLDSHCAGLDPEQALVLFRKTLANDFLATRFGLHEAPCRTNSGAQGIAETLPETGTGLRRWTSRLLSR